MLDLDGSTNPRLHIRGFLELLEKRGLFLNFRCGRFCCAELPYGGLPKRLVVDGPKDRMAWEAGDELTQGCWINRKEGARPCYPHPKYLT